MPCDTVTIYQATLENVRDLTRLEEAAKTLGYSVSRDGEFIHLQRKTLSGIASWQLRKLGSKLVGQLTGARLTQEDQAQLTAELMKGYAKATVAVAAKKFGWRMIESKTDQVRLARR